MENGYELLTEKEAMWAEMLMQVLKDNDIPCISLPVYGAGLTVKTGMTEWLRVCVPAECMQTATDLMQQLFSAESIQE